MKNYKVGFTDGHYKEFEVEDLTIHKGSILFFDDKECDLIKAIIQPANWNYLEAINKESYIISGKTK